MADVLNFSSENFLGYIDSRWVLTDSVLTSDGLLQINPTGTATLELTNEVNEDFKYIMFKVEFSGDSITPENNYKTNPTVYFREVYKDINANSVNKTIIRALGLNTFTTTDNGYLDTSIFATANTNMSKLQLKITNKTDSPFYIHSIQAFKSIDISQSQVSKLTQTITKAGAAQKFKVYHNDDAVKSLNGLGVYIENSTTQIKYGLSFYDGQIIAINTNFGQTATIEHVIGQIDLNTSD